MSDDKIIFNMGGAANTQACAVCGKTDCEHLNPPDDPFVIRNVKMGSELVNKNGDSISPEAWKSAVKKGLLDGIDLEAKIRDLVESQDMRSQFISIGALREGDLEKLYKDAPKKQKLVDFIPQNQAQPWDFKPMDPPARELAEPGTYARNTVRFDDPREHPLWPQHVLRSRSLKVHIADYRRRQAGGDAVDLLEDFPGWDPYPFIEQSLPETEDWYMVGPTIRCGVTTIFSLKDDGTIWRHRWVAPADSSLEGMDLVDEDEVVATVRAWQAGHRPPEIFDSFREARKRYDDSIDKAYETSE